MSADSSALHAQSLASQSSTFNAPTRWLWLIVALAAFLRLFPIWFGLPFLSTRPDEAASVGHALAIVGGDPNPHFFHWPSLTFYVFAALFAIASAVKHLLTGESTLTPAECIVFGRIFVAIAGTLTTVVLFRLGRQVMDTVTGLLAAAFLAVAILHVRDSHFAMTDVLMTLFLTISLMLLAEALDTAVAAPEPPVSRAGRFAAAGFAGGLATSTKYSAAAVIVAMAAAQLVLLVRFRKMPWSPRMWPPSVAFLAAFTAGFLVATPYALLDMRTFSTDFAFNFTHLSGGHGINLGRGWSYHLTQSLPYGVGIFVFAAAFPGIVLLAKQSPRHAFVLGVFSAAFYASIGSGYTVFFRYVLPLVPIVSLLAAVTVRVVGLSAGARFGVSATRAAVICGVVVALPSLVNSVWFDVLLARTDTRVLASQWIIPRLQAGDSVYDSGGEYSAVDLGRTASHVWRFDPSANSFGDPQGRTPDWLVLHQSPLRTYGNHPAALRQLASEKYDLVWEVRATRGAAGAAVYDLQDAFFMPIAGFRSIMRPGPTILIYRKRDK